MQNRFNLRTILGYCTLAITLGIIFFFLIYPVGTIVLKAFYNGDTFTLQYFNLLFANELHKEAILNSLYIGIGTVIFSTILTVPLSIINTKYDYFGKVIISGLLLVPMVMPPFVGAIGFQRFFSRWGSINLTLKDWGLIDAPIDWLADENLIWVVIALQVLHLYPIMYLNITAALANVDPSLEEQAKISGASRFQVYKDIIIPLSRPGYFAGTIIVFIWAMTDLGTPLLVGFHESMPVKIFNLVTDAEENPVGFALVFIVIALTVSIFIVSKLAFSQKKTEMMARGHVNVHYDRPGFIKYGVFVGFSLAVIFLALLPHITVFITSIGDNWFMTPLPESYTLKYYHEAFFGDLSWNGIKNSFYFAGASTFFDLVLGLMIAYVVTRKLIPFSNLLDAIVMVPLALPGIVLAFGYVVTYSDTFLDPVNNPVPLLIIAYAIRRLPYMVRSAAAGLEQISKSLEEASLSFGASKLFTMRKIIVPLISANLIAGALLCFAYAMLDVSDSLILAMKDQFYPITKAIYALFLEQESGEFTASALGIITMLILTVCIISASMILGKKMGELFRS